MLQILLPAEDKTGIPGRGSGKRKGGEAQGSQGPVSVCWKAGAKVGMGGIVGRARE